MLQKVGGYEVAEKWLANNTENFISIFERDMKRESPFEVLCLGDCWNNNIFLRSATFLFVLKGLAYYVQKFA